MQFNSCWTEILPNTSFSLIRSIPQPGDRPTRGGGGDVRVFLTTSQPMERRGGVWAWPVGVAPNTDSSCRVSHTKGVLFHCAVDFWCIVFGGLTLGWRRLERWPRSVGAVCGSVTGSSRSAQAVNRGGDSGTSSVPACTDQECQHTQ